MSIKTFKCTVCSAEVIKPQSYAYKDGRACRHHPEVQQNHEDQEQIKKNDLKKHKTKLRIYGEYGNLDEDRFSKTMKVFEIKNPNEHCWCCHADGAYEHLFYERFLINTSKLELKSSEPISPFSLNYDKLGPNKEIQALMKQEFGDKIPLRRIELEPNYPDWKLNQILNKKGKQDKILLVRMTNIIVLCKECATKYEFPWLKAIDSKMPLDKMLLIGKLIKPNIDALAAEEIAIEEISNIMNK